MRGALARKAVNKDGKVLINCGIARGLFLEEKQQLKAEIKLEISLLYSLSSSKYRDNQRTSIVNFMKYGLVIETFQVFSPPMLKAPGHFKQSCTQL